MRVRFFNLGLWMGLIYGLLTIPFILKQDEGARDLFVAAPVLLGCVIGSVLDYFFNDQRPAS